MKATIISGGTFMSYKILQIDPDLAPFESDINLRMDNYKRKRKELLANTDSLVDFANGHEYFGFHRTQNGWVYREWAPAAQKLYLTGDFNNWNARSCPMKKKEGGVFEVELTEKDGLKVGQRVQTVVIYNGKELRRIPLYATRVVQDPKTITWCAELEDTFAPFAWTDDSFKAPQTPYIYECHIGMAQDKYEVGSYDDFRKNILPRIKKLGYNTIQIMAIMEHPYYASFGYQVSNFFAASSRYGHSTELKALINEAHKMGIAVLLDVVHSHAIKNTVEGINEFDGTTYQFFHNGAQGDHKEWGTKLFDYGKNEVLHFLLSNLKYWMTTFHFDGFRFDGVTSMLYHDHGLGVDFDNNSKYFSMNTDTQAITYLQLANELIHELNPHAISIAEDMSAMPGMCLKLEDGGIGFDFRLAMGVPDFWIKLLKKNDEDWDMDKLWVELSIRRKGEKNIGYAESHDQALVGDKTIMFRLCDADMYTGMSKFHTTLTAERGVALHKMIRLITSTLAGEGYLNFMGNEFGHPEWIDFPREGNGWSYHYCRRQWNLVDNTTLRYCELNAFDTEMIHFLRRERVLTKKTICQYIHQDDKIMEYTKGKLAFAFNFHPEKSFDGYFVRVEDEGKYRVVLSTDDAAFGGHERIDKEYIYEAKQTPNGWTGFQCYLPNRCGIVFKKMD